ncbi:helix-turn-helix domain-containing protein [Variovorax sp. KK3]|nr:helix-turn-helix transcriptional regulator [Variovorax sp. KK3]
MRSPPDPALLRAVAAELKARRAALGLNQEALAFAAGVDRTFVARLETCSTSPSLGTLFRLSTGLETDPGELVSAIAKRYRKEHRAAVVLDSLQDAPKKTTLGSKKPSG